jgi:hypothetical protein
MLPSRLACIASLWLCLVLAPTAHAQSDPSSAPADMPVLRERLSLREPMAPRVERSWYGWQTLVADLGSGTVVLGLLLSDSEATPVLVALTVWGLATPVLHVLHGNYAYAAVSLGARVAGVAASFLAAVFVFLASGWGNDPPSALLWVTPVAFVVGIAAIEAGYLAFEERKVVPGTARLRVAPLADRSTRTVGLAVLGEL